MTRSPGLTHAFEVMSVSQRINAERLVLLAWTRAILLQIAHPMIAAGVFEHSGFRSSPWAAAGRLHQTVKAMLALVFGSEAARNQAIAGILAIHRRVNGRLTESVGPFPAGTAYSAEDPALVLWVHATLLDSVPLVHELLISPLSAAEHDAYCAEAAPIAVALGARDDDVPRTRAALREYMESIYRSGVIAVGPQAAALARAVMMPPAARVVLPAAWLNELVTIGLLPDHVRAQYGFRWTPARARALPIALRAIRLLRRGTPDWLALWKDARPARH